MPTIGKTAALVTPTTAGFAYTALAVSIGGTVVALAVALAGPTRALAATELPSPGVADR